MWRFSAYVAIVLYGCVVLRNKSWMYDLTECWAAYPNHEVDSSLWWYYIIQTAFYWSLLLSCWFDVKRSDFKQICIHHVITISLLSLSWSTNFVRIGTVVLFLHDISDVAIEFAKLLHYSKCRPLAINIAFAAFLISWFATRVFYFPFVLMRSALFDAPGYIQANYSLLSLAQPLAPRLMILLLFCVRNTFAAGAPSDLRSDDEEEQEKQESQSCQPSCQDQIMLSMQASIRQCKSLSDLTGLTQYCCCKDSSPRYNRIKIMKTRKMLDGLRKRG
uniref:TLC domain-containing protein n=1 Tax=Ditylenchus dipsaci TaxID=166011 RepID=A0A915EM32_9BILA